MLELRFVNIFFKWINHHSLKNRKKQNTKEKICISTHEHKKKISGAMKILHLMCRVKPRRKQTQGI